MSLRIYLPTWARQFAAQETQLLRRVTHANAVRDSRNTGLIAVALRLIPHRRFANQRSRGLQGTTQFEESALAETRGYTWTFGSPGRRLVCASRRWTKKAETVSGSSWERLIYFGPWRATFTLAGARKFPRCKWVTYEMLVRWRVNEVNTSGIEILLSAEQTADFHLWKREYYIDIRETDLMKFSR